MVQQSRKNVFLYVLRLQDDKYYVGQTTNLPDRLRKHFGGMGSMWTRLYAPLEVVKAVELETSSWITAKVIENTLTLELMRIFGFENVRGGRYYDNNLSYDPNEHGEK